MNPNCGLPPLVKRHTVRRRSSSSGPSLRGKGGKSLSWPFLGVGVPSGSRSPGLVAMLNFGLFGGLSSRSSRRLIFLVTGTDPGFFGGSFPLSPRGLDLFWVRWVPEFHDPFRGCIAWSFWGTITYVAGPHYGQRVESCCWACLLFLFFSDLRTLSSDSCSSPLFLFL